jgi:hypothetical protein
MQFDSICCFCFYPILDAEIPPTSPYQILELCGPSPSLHELCISALPDMSDGHDLQRMEGSIRRPLRTRNTTESQISRFGARVAARCGNITCRLRLMRNLITSLPRPSMHPFHRLCGSPCTLLLVGHSNAIFFPTQHELQTRSLRGCNQLSKSAIELLIGILTQPFDGAPQTSFISAHT